MPEGTGRRGRGRPALYLDAADRQAAFRERREIAVLKGEAAVAMTDQPTLPFVKLLVDRLLAQSSDPERVRVELACYLAAAGTPTA